MRTSARPRAEIWTETHEPTGGMQRVLGPLYITGGFWFWLTKVGTRWLPYRLAWLVGQFAAVISWLVLRRVRRGLASNLAVILGPCGFVERERRLWRTFRVFAAVMIDRYRIFHTRKGLKIEVLGRENWDDTVGADNGCIMISAHFGNWEAASLVPGQLDKTMHVVREREVDSSSDQLLEQLYKSHEGERFKMHYAGDDTNLGANLLLAVRRGGIVGLSGDQPRTGQGFLRVEMFGRPTPVPDGPFVLARAAEVPILPVFGVRRGGLDYAVLVRPPIRVPKTKDRMADVQTGAQEFAAVFEAMVRQHPHSWFCWWPRWPREKTTS